MNEKCTIATRVHNKPTQKVLQRSHETRSSQVNLPKMNIFSRKHPSLPYKGIRIVELSKTLPGRLTGVLFADQGAEVLIERDPKAEVKPEDEYLDRGKHALPSDLFSAVPTADVIIVDGEDTKIDRQPSQIVLNVVAALPGDEAYGYLPADCSEGLLSALCGFFTDMSTTGPFIGRPVIYTPLPLCSVYAGVNGAVATAAALADRERCGAGRQITASRLACGVSAIGALCLKLEGTPEHLQLPEGLPKGLTMEYLESVAKEAAANAEKQLWLEQRLIPLGSPYKCADDHFILPIGAVNGNLAVRLLQHLGIYDQMIDSCGMVDVPCYFPENHKYLGRNLHDPMNLDWDVRCRMADLLTEAFKNKSADKWTKELCTAEHFPAVKVMSWEEWREDKEARKARIWTHVKGYKDPQVGRSAWVESAQPYPELHALKHIHSVPKRNGALPAPSGNVSKLPLEGFTLIDLTDVIAGPSCGRMFAELGANVIHIDPVLPHHTPEVMIIFQGETCAGKQSLICDVKTAAGKKILYGLVSKADLVLANKLYPQWERLGLDKDTLHKLNPNIIAVEVTAQNGEKKDAQRNNYPGYDPALQETTGTMHRFGPEDCPTFHGIASCVDYLCGYLGCWSGMTALVGYLRRKDGKGDWSMTSLACAASLTQLLLQKVAEPPSARGPFATGMNEGERVYKVADGWIYVDGETDMTEEVSSLTKDKAIEMLRAKSILATPVQKCKDLADRHRENPCKTVKFEKSERDGWVTERFAPTWFVYDGDFFACLRVI